MTISVEFELLMSYINKCEISVRLTLYLIWILTHLKLCLADAIHNFKWVKIIHIWQNGGQLFSNLAELMSHFIFNIFKMWYLKLLIKNENPNICDTGG